MPSRKATIKAAIIMITVLTALGITGVLVPSMIANSLSCTIGVTGYAATITFTSPYAQDDCDAYIQYYPGQFYLLSEQPTGTELCEGDIVEGHSYIMPQGMYPAHFIVRDTGLFHLIGSQLCKDLQPVT